VKLRVTPAAIIGGYEYLRVSTPCLRDLPESDDVEFAVTRRRDTQAYFLRSHNGGPHKIAVSERCVGLTSTLLALLAHEMVHFKQVLAGTETGVYHNAEFKRLYKTVCRIHGFDPLWFS
jgi:hypothetical protein